MNIDQGRWNPDQELEPAEQGERAPSRRWLYAAVAAAVLIAAAWLLFGGKKTEVASPPSVPSVTVMVPGRSPVASVISATGTLAARREMPVGVAGEGGMVSRVYVDQGDWVRAGQVLATVDRAVQAQQANQMGAQVAAAEADARIAQANLDRAQKLVARGFVSRADIDQKTATRDAARARVGVTRAQFGEMNARLARLDLRAPAAGLVLARAIEPGQIVSAGGTPLFRIAMGGALELRAKLPESDLAQLRPGIPAVVTPVGSTKGYSGTVWQLSPTIDPTSRQGEARIALSYDPALRPGGFARAVITSGTVVAPMLPESAVQSDAKGNFVYVVGPGDRVVRRRVKVGEVSDAGITVVAGLRGDEQVVVSAGAFLNPGDRIKPARTAARR